MKASPKSNDFHFVVGSLTSIKMNMHPFSLRYLNPCATSHDPIHASTIKVDCWEVHLMWPNANGTILYRPSNCRAIFHPFSNCRVNTWDLKRDIFEDHSISTKPNLPYKEKGERSEISF